MKRVKFIIAGTALAFAAQPTLAQEEGGGPLSETMLLMLSALGAAIAVLVASGDSEDDAPISV